MSTASTKPAYSIAGATAVWKRVNLIAPGDTLETTGNTITAITPAWAGRWIRAYTGENEPMLLNTEDNPYILVQAPRVACPVCGEQQPVLPTAPDAHPETFLTHRMPTGENTSCREGSLADTERFIFQCWEANRPEPTTHNQGEHHDRT